jgi:hypothetical protein
MAKKTKSAGALLQSFIGGVYVTIGQRISIEGPDGTNEMLDISDLDSVAVEKGPTLPDNGDVTMTVWFDPNDANHAQLEAWRTTPPATIPLHKIVFPTSPSKSVQFGAWVSGFKPTGMEAKGYLQAEVKLTISGGVTWV